MKKPNKLVSRAIAKKAAIIAGILISIGAISVALNWTFIRRLMTYPENPITSVDWYKPLETVKGQPSKLYETIPNSVSRQSLEEVTAYARSVNSSSLLVMHRGKLIWERYWQGFSSTSTSNSMSMAKTIAALLVGIAIEEGYIESELEPVANYIPEWSADERSKITLQDLLYMQSGLRNWDDTDNPASDLVQMYAGTNADTVAIQVPAVQSPGQTFNYNNVNTQILSEVLERATKQRYASYLSTRLWQPLQAHNAYLWLDRPQGNPKSFCCLFATPRDWAKIGQLFLNRGKVGDRQIVPSAWLDKMRQPSPMLSKYGYYIWLQARTEEKPGIYDRTSSQPFSAETFYLDGASRQRVYIIPSQELVIVRIGEQPQKWDDSIIPNTLIDSLTPHHYKK